MKIMIKRTYLKEDCTVGFLQVDGRYLCDTLEPHAIPWTDDPFIGQKACKRVAGKTAIPEGTYRIEVKDSDTYRRAMPFLQGVPQFKTVVLRTGKTALNTRGDILVGNLAGIPEQEATGHPADDPKLQNSRKCFNRLFKLMKKALINNEEILLTVRSHMQWGFERTTALS